MGEGSGMVPRANARPSRALACRLADQAQTKGPKTQTHTQNDRAVSVRLSRTNTRYEGQYKGATAPIYYTDAGATFGGVIRDGLTPTINQILKKIAPEVEHILQRELIDPVLEPALKDWPVGDYDKQRTSRRGGVSKKALQGAIEFDGSSIYAVIRNNARNPKGQLYAYLIFRKGSRRFIAGQGFVEKGINVWQTEVRRPFLKLARKIEGPLLRAIEKIAEGK